MNPADPASFNHHTERLSTGRTYHFVDQQPADKSVVVQTILCIHGFPDIWYGWRYQIGPWVHAGYRVVVPDMLGYGGTDKPRPAEEYSTKKLCADLAALLDVVGVSKAIVIGHDWGSFIAGRFALWHPDRLLALGILSVPFTPPIKEYRSLEELVKKAPNYAYQLYFADPESTKEINAHLERFLRVVFGTEKLEIQIVFDGNMREAVMNDRLTRHLNPAPLLTSEELRYVASQLRDMNGPLSYYRTTKTRFEEEKAAQLTDRRLPVIPVLHIWGVKDPTATPEMGSWMREKIPDFEEIRIPDASHWILVQARDDVTAEVLRWLSKVKVKVGAKL